MKILTLIFLFIISSATYADNEVSLACKWTLHGHEKESFVVNLSKKSVYWVNEDKRLPITKLNEGRIEFEGIRSSLAMSNGSIKNNIKIKYIINRVTGELYISGIKVPSGYNNQCITTNKIL